MKRKLSAAVILVAAAILAWAGSAGAVDGTIEINQAKVLAAGGFPFTIGTSGSYRLTGNLTVSSTTGDAIDVTVNHVTIDLNGFSIVGPGSGSGDGIYGAAAGTVTVENGTVTGFGSEGVVVGSSGIVRNVHADANGNGIQGGNNAVIEGCTANSSIFGLGIGIICSAGCVISGNTANGNPGRGIQVGNGSVISGNTAFHNTNVGIDCNGSGCLITGNTAFNNGTGLAASDATTGYAGNVLDQTTNVSNGTNLGHNLCSGTICP
jgi:parallel beta-helix repeat protein